MLGEEVVLRASNRRKSQSITGISVVAISLRLLPESFRLAFALFGPPVPWAPTHALPLPFVVKSSLPSRVPDLLPRFHPERSEAMRCDAMRWGNSVLAPLERRTSDQFAASTSVASAAAAPSCSTAACEDEYAAILVFLLLLLVLVLSMIALTRP